MVYSTLDKFFVYIFSSKTTFYMRSYFLMPKEPCIEKIFVKKNRLESYIDLSYLLKKAIRL